MKLMNSAVLMAACVWVAGCATPMRTDSDESEDVVVSRRAELDASGLSCPLCASNLDDQVARIPGVKSARIDFETGTMHVEIEPGEEVRKSQLVKAVEDAGFTPREFRLVEEEAP